MASSDQHRIDRLLWQDPWALTGLDLHKITLSTLSKALPPDFPAKSTVELYLRWLEMHRKNPTKGTEHWANTTLHWAQALRARGISESDLLWTLHTWKEATIKAKGHFRISWDRYPPMPQDIRRAFEDRKGGASRPRDGICDDKYERPRDYAEEFMRPPPGNYTCNRCGQKGELLL
jgi:hypothetical protein